MKRAILNLFMVPFIAFIFGGCSALSPVPQLINKATNSSPPSYVGSTVELVNVSIEDTIRRTDQFDKEFEKMITSLLSEYSFEVNSSALFDSIYAEEFAKSPPLYDSMTGEKIESNFQALLAKIKNKHKIKSSSEYFLSYRMYQKYVDMKNDRVKWDGVSDIKVDIKNLASATISSSGSVRVISVDFILYDRSWNVINKITQGYNAPIEGFGQDVFIKYFEEHKPNLRNALNNLLSDKNT